MKKLRDTKETLTKLQYRWVPTAGKWISGKFDKVQSWGSVLRKMQCTSQFCYVISDMMPTLGKLN